MDLVADLTLVLLAALVGGFLAQRARQPLIVGYLLAGVVIGPFSGGFTVVNPGDIERLAELGVALLLFSLGLEMSFRELAAVRGIAIGGTAVQICVTAAAGAFLAVELGWAWQPAVWMGALVSLSSTMVALKTVQAQGRLGTLSSRVMLGILVVQDLAVVPLMIVLPEISHGSVSPLNVVAAAARALALLIVIVVVATRIVPRLMAVVARRNSRELFLLTTTAAALGIGWITWSFGLSLALGAFVAGLVINESDYAHQALSDVAPLRDLFGMLFFVSEGMLLDPRMLWQNAGAVAIVLVTVSIGKALILGIVVRMFGYRHVVPLAVGLTLFQVGEFAFVLARVGRSSGAIPEDLYAVVLNTAIVTMALTPAISGLTPIIYERFRGRGPREAPLATNLPDTGLTDHVIIAGAGRVGYGIAEALARLGLPFVLVELDDRRRQQARAAGLPLIYGDAMQPVVLEAAGLGQARAVLVTVPAFTDVRAIVRAVRERRPDVPIVARADSGAAVAALSALGVNEVTSPEFEASIEMTRQALMHFDLPPAEIQDVARAIRRARYGRVEAP